jgi:hypothetical protein
MKNTGKEYEDFVKNLQQAILNSEGFAKQKNILLEKNKLITDRNGIKREFDLYWEYELGGVSYKTVIECRDYETTISIKHIDGLVGKLIDLPGLKPVFATKKGYQDGALKKAKQHDIDLLIVREQNDSDWSDEYGNPLLKGIHVIFDFITPASITNFQPMTDVRWIKENRPDIDVTKPFQVRGFNNEIFIDDIGNNKKYSLYDLAENLTVLEDNKPGNYEREEKFSEAYVLYGDNKIKLLSYKVFYCIPKHIETEIDIDYSKELTGVVEYLNKGIKKKIFSDGVIHQDKLV